jgi:ubiquinone/menaquinone biosynthesis C-methylase UbiE
MSPEQRSAQVAAVFDQVAGTYDAAGVPWFTPIGEALVRELAPVPGERALDIGCGRGAALFPLAEAVGPSGHVTGIDLAPRMVAATAADARARGLTTVELTVMDASAPDLPGGYSVLASSLVLFFLPDPAAALRAWLRLLVPGGRLGVATFGPRPPVWAALDALFQPYLPEDLLDARTSGTTGPFGSDEGMAELLREAGYDRVRTVGFELRTAFADAEHWHRWSLSHGQWALWQAVPAADRPQVRAAAAELLAAHQDADGRIRLTQPVRLTLGHRPDS